MVGRISSNPESVDAELCRWRARLYRALLVGSLGVSLVVTIWYVLPGPQHDRVLAAITFGAGCLTLLTTVLSLSLRVRSALLLSGIFACTLAALLIRGAFPNTVLAFALVVVTAQLLLGTRAAILGILASTVALLAAGWASYAGLLENILDYRMFDPHRFQNALRIATIYAAMVGSLVLAVGYVLGRTERLARRAVEALAAAEREQAERERLAAELREREVAYRKASELESLGRLSGSVAHDFNNALAVLMSALDELEHAGRSPAAREAAFAAARDAIRQAATTTQQLRVLHPKSRPTEATAMFLGQAVKSACALLRRLLPARIALELEIVDDAPVSIDESELGRALVNLTLNACDAMRGPGRLTLRQFRDPASPKSLCLELTDTGAGMTEETLARLFEPYFTTKEQGGTGLGLHGVREWARRNGGELSVASRLGQGTTVTLSWPEPDAVSAPELSKALSLLWVESTSERLAVLSRDGLAPELVSSIEEARLVVRRRGVSLALLGVVGQATESRPALLGLIDEYRALRPLGQVLVVSDCRDGWPEELDVVTCATELEQRLEGLIDENVRSHRRPLSGRFAFAVRAG